MMRRPGFLLALSLGALGWCSCAFAQSNPDGKLPVFQFPEPYLILVRDPVVHRELKLTDSQRQQLQMFNDEQDAALWTTRNQTAERATQIVLDLIARTRQQLPSILEPDQIRRLDEIELWVQGLRSLQRPEVISKLGLTSGQQEKSKEIAADYQAEFQKLKERAQNGEALAPLEKKNGELQQDAYKKTNALLKPAQRTAWQTLLGRPLDPNQLGGAKFKAPEIRGQGEWVNSRALTLESLKGKVVALHFWTFGCSNCIHNYPSYKNWTRDFAGKELVILGIHTPEGKSEHDLETLKSKAAENELTFPIVVDNQSENWNAWGNSMWPTVYLIDKQGYVRYWWMGELNWQGQTGEKLFSGHITELLKE